MQAAVLAIGTELTRGELVNGNAAWLSDRLTGLGLEVVEHAVVADDSVRVRATLARFGREVKLVVCTGGLGPTSDDLTAQAVADLLGQPLERHEPTLERIRARYRKIDRPIGGDAPALRGGASLPAINAKQADVPAGARVLDNDEGTAPGFVVQIGDARCYFFPGVPREMRHLFERYLVPDVAPQVQRTSVQIHIRSFGLRESEAAERLADIDLGGARHRPGIVIGYRAHFPEIEVKVLANAADEIAARALATEVAAEAQQRLAPHAYGGRDDDFPRHVGRLLRARGLKLAVAESCTGGLIGKLLTDPAGSSDYFLLDVVSYANSAKRDVLGVSAALLDRHGAVSAEVAAAMAQGVLEKAGADLAVATTGVAGPGGGTADKPVGTVWLAVVRRGEKPVTERIQAPGDRDRVRVLTAYVALSRVAQAATSWPETTAATAV